MKTKSKNNRHSKPKRMSRKSTRSSRKRHKNSRNKRRHSNKISFKIKKTKSTHHKMKGGFNENCLPNDNGEYVNHEATNQEFMNKCPICLDTVKDGNSINCKLIECCHTFHYECVKPIFETNQTCPTCRDNIVSYFRTNKNYIHHDTNNNSQPGSKRVKRENKILWINSGVRFAHENNNDNENNNNDNDINVDFGPIPEILDMQAMQDADAAREMSQEEAAAEADRRRRLAAEIDAEEELVHVGSMFK
jgi:hypothetical protein